MLHGADMGQGYRSRDCDRVKPGVETHTEQDGRKHFWTVGDSFDVLQFFGEFSASGTLSG